MKIKDLPLLSVLGDAFKIPISDITSDRALAVTLGQILEYCKNSVKTLFDADEVTYTEKEEHTEGSVGAEIASLNTATSTNTDNITALTTEVSELSAKEANNETAINAEAMTRSEADTNLQNSITNEVERAKAKEDSLEEVTEALSDLITDNTTAIEDEVARATEAEEANKQSILNVDSTVHGNIEGTIATEGQVLTKGSGVNEVMWADPQGGISDAPEDNKQYVRKNGTWVENTGGTGIPDAPEDGKQYARKDGAWSEVEDAGIGDAPSDDKEYVRKNAAWVEGSGMSTEDKEKLDAYPTYAELLKIITDNEKVAAAAIKELNDRLAAIEGESLYILAD